MAKKSAAKMKVVKSSNEEYDWRAEFEATKQVLLATLDTQLLISDRITFITDIKDSYDKFFGESEKTITYSEANTLVQIIKSLYMDIKNYIEDMTIDSIIEEYKKNGEFEDVFKIEQWEINNADNWFTAWELRTEFECVRPYCEKITNMKKLVIEFMEAEEKDGSES